MPSAIHARSSLWTATCPFLGNSHARQSIIYQAIFLSSYTWHWCGWRRGRCWFVSEAPASRRQSWRESRYQWWQLRWICSWKWIVLRLETEPFHNGRSSRCTAGVCNQLSGIVRLGVAYHRTGKQSHGVRRQYGYWALCRSAGEGRGCSCHGNMFTEKLRFDGKSRFVHSFLSWMVKCIFSLIVGYTVSMNDGTETVTRHWLQ